MEKKICIKNSCGKIYTPENDEEYEARTCCAICGAPVEVDLGDYPYEIVEEEKIVKKICDHMSQNIYVIAQTIYIVHTMNFQSMRQDLNLRPLRP